MANNLLPLFVPETWTPDRLLRPLTAGRCIIFSAAYVAEEVCNGGLQSLGRGQYEAAMALGLKYAPMTGLIIPPRAPDLGATGQRQQFHWPLYGHDAHLDCWRDRASAWKPLNNAIKDPVWAGPALIMVTGYVFVASFYFIFCFWNGAILGSYREKFGVERADVMSSARWPTMIEGMMLQSDCSASTVVWELSRLAEHQPDGCARRAHRGLRPVWFRQGRRLIRCVNRLEEHQRGSIVVDGVELTEDIKRIDEVRREVGMVFQNFSNLFPHLTILENCTLVADLGA